MQTSRLPSIHAEELFSSPVHLSAFLGVEGVGSHHDGGVCDHLISACGKRKQI